MLGLFKSILMIIWVYLACFHTLATHARPGCTELRVHCGTALAYAEALQQACTWCENAPFLPILYTLYARPRVDINRYYKN